MKSFLLDIPSHSYLILFNGIYISPLLNYAYITITETRLRDLFHQSSRPRLQIPISTYHLTISLSQGNLLLPIPTPASRPDCHRSYHDKFVDVFSCCSSI
jgi:hypothetical protein